MTIKNRLIATLNPLKTSWLYGSVAIVALFWRKSLRICLLRIYVFYPNDAREEKRKSFENNLVFKAFSLFIYLCLFLLRLGKNVVENHADDGGEADAGNGEGTG